MKEKAQQSILKRIKVNSKLKGFKEYKVQKVICIENYWPMIKVRIWIQTIIQFQNCKRVLIIINVSINLRNSFKCIFRKL